MSNYCYPGGMLQPGRSFSSDNYRFGFNGQEKVDEISGTGNHNTALFWEYDTRLLRRWNLDPVDQVNVSNYATFVNNPIFYTDPNGDCPTCPDDAENGATHEWGGSTFTYNGDEGTWATTLNEVKITADRDLGAYGYPIGSNTLETETSYKASGYQIGAYADYEYAGAEGKGRGFGVGYDGDAGFGLSGIYAEGGTEAYGLKGDALARIGTDRWNAFGAGEGAIFLAEAEGMAGVYTGADDNYGAMVGAGAGAYALKGDASFGVTVFGTKIKLTYGGSLGSAHIGADLGVLYNSESGDFKAKGKVHVGLGAGVKFGFEITNEKN